MGKVQDVKAKAIKVTLNDGVERELKFTLNALAELEDRYGSVEEAFKMLEEKNSVKALRCVLWAGFLYNHPELTEQQVGNLIDIAYLQDLTGTVNKALAQDMPSAAQMQELNKSEEQSDPND